MDTFARVFAYFSADFISTPEGLRLEPIGKARTDPAAGVDSWIRALNSKGCTPILNINQTPAWFWASQSQNQVKSAAQAASFADTYNPFADFSDWAANGAKKRAVFNQAQFVPDHPPIISPGTSRVNPDSYAAYARIFGEVAKRYGKNKHPEGGLWVNTSPRWTNDPPNERISGLGLKFGLQVWNEPDKWWHKGDGSGIYFEPEEYAALFAACYAEIKAADPTVPVYMAGLTGFDMEYMTRFVNALKSMGKPLPDVFDLHHYSHAGNRVGVWPPTWYDGGACAPEQDQDFEGVRQFVDFAKLHGKPLSVSEFGCDTRGPSWMWAKPIAGKSSEQLQATWVCRSYMEYMRLGVGSSAVFNGNDEQGAENGGLYTNSGLLYGEGEPGKVFAPKPSYIAVTGLIRSLQGLEFVKDVSTANCRAMMFKKQDGSRVLAAWWPTVEGKNKMADLEGKTLQVTEDVQFFNL